MEEQDNIHQFSGRVGDAPPNTGFTYARNCITNSSTDDSGLIGNEPANKHLISTAFPIIGFIYLYDDQWIIFSTNDITSEIGRFREFTAKYDMIIRDPGLNFNRLNLISGEAKQNFDCTWSVYFSDGYRNVDRCVNVDNPQLAGTYGVDTNGCQTFTAFTPHRFDLDKIRLVRPVKMPCLVLSKGSAGGNLLNGTYYAVVAYTVNGQKVTNYSGLSNAVSIFDHSNLAGTVDINITNLDESYDQFELVVISVVNAKPVARRLGLFGTNQHKISFDILSNELPTVPLEFLPIVNPVLPSSKAITSLSERLVRIAPRSKFSFNYQPLANQINLHWVSVEYPADYYKNGGVNQSHLRDENYAAFIRWVYDDGDKTDSFHIPGRAPNCGEDSLAVDIYGDDYFFEKVNTATTTSAQVIDNGDGGYVIAEGQMGYFETDNRYPINKPSVWGNLCGKKIRHHKFPERSLNDRTNIYTDQPLSPIAGPVIRVLGVKALNIKAPLDNQGVPIKGIVGYELLFGSREGNRTIVAKGIVNNLFAYNLSDGSGKGGAYPNFPYNALRDDPFVSGTETSTQTMSGDILNLNPIAGFDPNTGNHNNLMLDVLTFHSPETTFSRPFLSTKELKLDGVVKGEPILKFIEPAEHPKHKLPTNFAFFISSLIGIGLGVSKMVGSRNITNSTPSFGGGVGVTAIAVPFLIASLFTSLSGKIKEDDNIEEVKDDGGEIVEAKETTVEGQERSERRGSLSGALNRILDGGKKLVERVGGIGRAIGKLFRSIAMGGLALFSQIWGEGIDTVMTTIMNFSQWQQYALQQISHCFYNEFYVGPDNYTVPAGCTVGWKKPTLRYAIKAAKYLGPSFQEFDNDLRINNLYRSSTVALRTSLDTVRPEQVGGNSVIDTSKQTLYTISQNFQSPADQIHSMPTKLFAKTVASSHYASLKVRLRNQYGQVDSVKQIPAGCINYVTIVYSQDVFNSPVIFGGDAYITRYTEKNTMFFFYDWLYKQFDGYEFDYLKNRTVQWPAYWANTQKFDIGDFTRGLTDNLGGSITSLINQNYTQPNINKQSPWLPTGFRALDRKANVTDIMSSSANTPVGGSFKRLSLFVVKEAYFYLFVSGVRDFYVESEINVGYRDWEEPIQKRHYDHSEFTDVVSMFKADPTVITADNFNKYDYSLSAQKTFIHFVSWGTVQPPYYDPQLAETCFVYHPKRAQWSQLQRTEDVIDNWRIFLVNDYRVFESNITTIKSVNQTGAIILFESESPQIIMSDEQMKLSTTSVTIGDGSFLARMSQNVSNADRPYQAGITKDARGVAYTPAGLFWMSAEQGKIFMLTDGLMEIAMPEISLWLSKYLKYFILDDFPNFNSVGNPVAGVGCQVVFDSKSGIVYFCKKDYKLRNLTNIDLNVFSQFVIYVPGTATPFQLWQKDGNGIESFLYSFALGDPVFFEDVSWTMGYHVADKKWLGWNDWHPDLVMPSFRTFNTVKGAGIWKHNDRCDLYCNYYGENFPWEVEFVDNTGIQTKTLQSIEYYLEAYKYASNCIDRYMYLEENFDEMVVFNNEQCSGLLKLFLTPFGDPVTALQYPKYNFSDVSVLFSRVENKFRINGFVDLTDDRGQFDNARRMMWITAGNGYDKEVNIQNLDYQKDPFERKKFRGYTSYVFFSRKVSGNVKFLMLFAVNKKLDSKR